MVYIASGGLGTSGNISTFGLRATYESRADESPLAVCSPGRPVERTSGDAAAAPSVGVDSGYRPALAVVQDKRTFLNDHYCGTYKWLFLVTFSDSSFDFM